VVGVAATVGDAAVLADADVDVVGDAAALADADTDVLGEADVLGEVDLVGSVGDPPQPVNRAMPSAPLMSHRRVWCAIMSISFDRSGCILVEIMRAGNHSYLACW
jgi:hypothetical protein